MQFLLALCTCLLFLIVYSNHADAVITPTVSIKEESPPKGSSRIISKDGNIEIIGLIGQKVILECLPLNIDKNAKVRWMWLSTTNQSLFEVINDGMRAKDTSRWKITRGTAMQNAIRLEIPTVSMSYQGVLECRIAYQDNTQPVIARRILKVFALPKIVQYQSSFETTVSENNNATLSCNATGIPKPVISWRRIGGSSSVIRGYGREVLGSKIVFTKALPSDRGTYICKALNSMGEVNWKVKLNVMFKPRVSIFTGNVNSEITQKIGCEMQLLCIVTANPLPGSLVWGVNTGMTIADDKKRMRIYKMEAADYTTYYSVSFEPTRSGDFGTYTCSATNSKGTGTALVNFKETTVAQPYRSGLIRCRASSSISKSLILVFVIPLAFVFRQ